MNKFSYFLFKTFFQKKCCLCHQKNNYSLCKLCQSYLPNVTTFCKQCGNYLENSTTICGHCLSTPPFYQHTFSCYWYEEPIKTLIHEYKFREKLFLTPILGKLMTKKISQYYRDNNLCYPECIIPLPLHPKRLQKRGYHQVYELAKILSKNFSLPIDLNTCRRIRHTPPQSETPFKDRKNNVKNVFLTYQISYKHIAIIDDVMTTGETISSLCQAFLKINPELKIDIWCLARTISKN